LLRDKGFIVNAEFDYPMLRGGQNGLSINMGPFFDLGRGKNIGEDASTISSCGIATKVGWHSLTVDLSVAKKLAHPQYIKDSNATLQDRGIEFRVSYSL
jgi:hemolysin activation/secretion protein